MKKRILALFMLFAILCLTACGGKEGVLQPHFTGEVIEVYEYGCLMMVIDKENSTLPEGDLVSVSTNISNCPIYERGDLLKITFDGSVAESYPLSIHKVYSVYKVNGDGVIVE